MIHIDQGQLLGSSCSKQGAPLRCWLSAQQGEPKEKKLRGKHAKQKNRWPKITRLEFYQWKNRLEFLCEKQLFFFRVAAVRGPGFLIVLSPFWNPWEVRDFLDFLLRLVFPTSSTGSSTFRRTLPLQPSAQVETTFWLFFLLKKIVLSRFRNPRKTSCYDINKIPWETWLAGSSQKLLPDGHRPCYSSDSSNFWGETEKRCLWQDSCKAALLRGDRRWLLLGASKSAKKNTPATCLGRRYLRFKLRIFVMWIMYCSKYWHINVWWFCMVIYITWKIIIFFLYNVICEVRWCPLHVHKHQGLRHLTHFYPSLNPLVQLPAVWLIRNPSDWAWRNDDGSAWLVSGLG